MSGLYIFEKRNLCARGFHINFQHWQIPILAIFFNFSHCLLSFVVYIKPKCLKIAKFILWDFQIFFVKKMSFFTKLWYFEFWDKTNFLEGSFLTWTIDTGARMWTPDSKSNTKVLWTFLKLRNTICQLVIHYLDLPGLSKCFEKLKSPQFCTSQKKNRRPACEKKYLEKSALYMGTIPAVNILELLLIVIEIKAVKGHVSMVVIIYFTFIWKTKFTACVSFVWNISKSVLMTFLWCLPVFWTPKTYFRSIWICIFFQVNPFQK